jgi:hypothetical protein
MTIPFTLEGTMTFRRRGRGGRKELCLNTEKPPVAPPVGRIPRVARLMALALRFEELLRQGVVSDYSALAALGQVSRARISQIMNLLYLAPDLQEQLLFLPPTPRGRDPIPLAQLQPLAAALDWKKQRRLWAQLVNRR